MKYVNKILFLILVVSLPVLLISCSGCVRDIRREIKHSRQDKEREERKKQIEGYYNDIVSHCSDNEFAEAHEDLNSIFTFCSTEKGRYNEEYYYSIYWDAEDYLFNAESQYLISHVDDKQSINRICYMLTSMPEIGKKFPNETKLSYPGDSFEESEKYVNCVARYNQKCDRLLLLAIGINNETLAKRIISLYKDDYEMVEYESYQYKVVISEKSKKSAQKKYNYAFK